MSNLQSIIIGIDGCGEGALAGPIVVAAVAFPTTIPPVRVTYHTLDGEQVLEAYDSKSIKNPGHREALARAIKSEAIAYAVVEKHAKEIDQKLVNQIIPEMLTLAAARLIERLSLQYKDPRVFKIIIDGQVHPSQDFPCAVECLVEADKKIWQVGAASLLAKVARDAKMQEYDSKYPQYQFSKHKGYAVALHKTLLKQHGASPIHRQSFSSVRALRPKALGIEE